LPILKVQKEFPPDDNGTPAATPGRKARGLEPRLPSYRIRGSDGGGDMRKVLVLMAVLAMLGGSAAVVMAGSGQTAKNVDPQ
jgi:hypothetical protein